MNTPSDEELFFSCFIYFSVFSFVSAVILEENMPGKKLEIQ